MNLQSMFSDNQFYIKITFLEFFVIIQNFLFIVVRHATHFTLRALNWPYFIHHSV